CARWDITGTTFDYW
nr:immunoglobulin heavy chain junction region [Macaca mulatta]